MSAAARHPRPGAHQNDLSARTAGVIQFVFENLLRRRLVTGLHQAGKAAAKTHTRPRSDGVPSRWSDAFSNGCASSWPSPPCVRGWSAAALRFFSQHARASTGGGAA